MTANAGTPPHVPGGPFDRTFSDNGSNASGSGSRQERTLGAFRKRTREAQISYADLPFVLIGDSGQKDPEVYARIMEAHPGRVVAVYVRDVSNLASRDEEIEHLSAAAKAAGSHLVLADDSVAMARHMPSIGLVEDRDFAAVAEEARSARSGPR